MTKKLKNYLSHEKLKITFAEYGALLGVLTMLKAGILVDAQGRDRPKEKLHLFNMSVPLRSQDCGTVGCIGGHMALILGKQNADDAHYYVHGAGRSVALHPLFFPAEIGCHKYKSWSEIPIPVTVAAIENFLYTGEPRWRDADKLAG